MEVELTTHLNEVAAHIQRAKTHYKIYRVYQLEREEFLDAMNEYVDFFKASIESHSSMTIISLAKLFETREDTYNISRLFILLRKENFQFDEDYFKNELQPRLRKYYNIRNELYCHSSIKFNQWEVFEKASITHEDIQALIEDFERWYAKIYKDVLNITHTFPTLKSDKSIRSILKKLKNDGKLE